LADWLDDEIPIEWLADLLNLVWKTPNLDWLLLTKRPENWRNRLAKVLRFTGDNMLSNSDPCFREWLSCWLASTDNPYDPPENIWIGTSVEDQQRADERIPHLLSIPAKVRFLSCEPLLGPVDLHLMQHNYCIECDAGMQHGVTPAHAYNCPDKGKTIGITWIICGGESGRKARPMDAEWARSLRDQCEDREIPFFMKQMGGIENKRHKLTDLPEDLRIREFPI
jgi:protein gp37